MRSVAGAVGLRDGHRVSAVLVQECSVAVPGDGARETAGGGDALQLHGRLLQPESVFFERDVAGGEAACEENGFFFGGGEAQSIRLKEQ